jgi:O-succinylbenzoic acid--CoA ligase
MDLQQFLNDWHSPSPTILVHTSGSTGSPKPMLVEKRRMEASARITCDFLGLKKGDTALLCMSLDYIAGKMMVVRALTCGLRLISVEPSGKPLGTVADSIDFAAMVPLQVWNSLQVPEERDRLMAIRHLIIGGGAIDDTLASALVDFPHQVWSTYGMTETLSHIALRRLNGPDRSDWYTPFDSVNVSLNADGCLVIDAPAVHDGPLVTNDIAVVEGSRFRILGRKDNVICSGGIKIQMEEVERLLRSHVRVPFMITKTPDKKLGEQVVLLTESSDVAALQALCRSVLPKYFVPRRILTVPHLPLTETGKPARADAQRMATAL